MEQRYVDINSSLVKVDLNKDKVNNDSLVVVLNFCFSSTDTQPIANSIRYQRVLNSANGEPYSRKLVLKEHLGWVNLIDQTCWVNRPGVIIVHNMFGLGKSAFTKEEFDIMESKYVLVDVGGTNKLIVRASCFVLFECERADAVKVKSNSGDINIYLFVFPR